MRGQEDRHVDRVQDPSKDDLGCVLGVVSFDELLEQDDLFLEGDIASIEGPKDFVNGVHEESTDALFVG